MALITITGSTPAERRAALLNELNLPNRLTDDTIQVPPGVIDEFKVPRNLGRPLAIRPSSISNPPTFRGIQIGNADAKGNFAHLASDPSATSVSQLTIAGVRIEAPRYTSAKDPNGVTRDIRLHDGGGIGWRTCGTSHPSGALGGYSENSNFIGLRLASGTKNCTFEDIIFNGFANALTMSGVTDCLFSHLRMEDGCEDYIKFGNFTRIAFEWIEMLDIRGPTAITDNYQGWTNDETVHADGWQQLAAGNGLIIRNCFLHDATQRLHCGLLRPPEGYPMSSDFLLENVESQTSHPTGWAIGRVNGLTVRRVKGSAIGALTGGGPVLQLLTGTRAITGTVDVHDNQFVRIQMGGHSGSNNTTNNNPNSYPAGFVQVREDKVASGEEHVGPYGKGGVTPQPTKPTPLNAGQWTIEATGVQDPDLPGDDPRRVPVVRIDTTSPAFPATEVRWQNDVDPGARATVEIEPAGDGDRRFRMTSNNGSHLVYPGGTLSGIGCYYKLASLAERSERSTGGDKSFSLASEDDVLVPVPYVDLTQPFESLWYCDDEGELHGPILSIHLEEGQIWPAASQISFVNATGYNATGGTLPTGNVDGDTYVTAALATNGTTPPTVPTGSGWAAPADDADVDPTVSGVAQAGALASKVSNETTEMSGTWSAAQSLAMALYRGVDQADPFLSVKWATGSGNPVSWPALTHDDPKAWVVLFHRFSNDVEIDVPDGFVERHGNNRRTIRDSNGAKQTFAGSSATAASGPGTWITCAVALKSA